jgi:hypothetical protein
MHRSNRRAKSTTAAVVGLGAPTTNGRLRASAKPTAASTCGDRRRDAREIDSATGPIMTGERNP